MGVDCNIQDKNGNILCDLDRAKVFDDFIEMDSLIKVDSDKYIANSYKLKPPMLMLMLVLLLMPPMLSK